MTRWVPRSGRWRLRPSRGRRRLYIYGYLEHVSESPLSPPALVEHTEETSAAADDYPPFRHGLVDPKVPVCCKSSVATRAVS